MRVVMEGKFEGSKKILRSNSKRKDNYFSKIIKEIKKNKKTPVK